MKYLLDTSWAIYYLRGEERVVRKLLSLKEEGLAMSMISLAELYEGVFRSRDPVLAEKSLRDFLTRVSILGIDEKICKIFGRERAKLRKSGKIIGDLDLLIASTSLCYNLILLTENVREFEKVENLKILKE
jgi:tRNA(fMet)-specific endonuclease VapC